MGCTGPKDCPRGQDCTNGRCTGTAEVDELADTAEVDELADTEPRETIEPEETTCDP